MPISERWRKFPATRRSRFLFLASVLLAIALAYVGARFFTHFLNHSVRPNAPWHYLLQAFGLAALATTMIWLEHQTERGEITKGQRKIADVIAILGGVLGLIGATVYPWLMGELVALTVVLACCAVALAIGWLMARRNQRRSAAPQDLS